MGGPQRYPSWQVEEERPGVAEAEFAGVIYSNVRFHQMGIAALHPSYGRLLPEGEGR